MRRRRRARRLHHHRRILRGELQGPRRRGQAARDRQQLGPAARRPEHHRHGQCRGRHDGELRQFPPLGNRRRLAVHPDRHFHRRGHAAYDDLRHAAPAGRARASTSATKSTSTSWTFSISSPKIPEPRSSGSISKASAIRARSWSEARAVRRRKPIVRAQAGPHHGRRQSLGLAYGLARLRRRDPRRRVAPVRHRARRGRGRVPQCAARSGHAAEAARASGSALRPRAARSA